MFARILPVMVVAVVALGLTGCGSDDASTSSDASDATVAITAPTTTTTAAATTFEDVTAGAATARPTADPTATVNSSGPAVFASPSRNIGCAFNDDQRVSCEIADKTYTAIPGSQAQCEDGGDFTDKRFALDAVGPEGSGCFSNSVLPNDATTVLAYGSSAQRGLFRCDSAATGITCYNVKTGKGFSIARSIYVLF